MGDTRAVLAALRLMLIALRGEDAGEKRYSAAEGIGAINAKGINL